MGYASDYDDFEQAAQGADPGESDLESLCRKMFGLPIWELSQREFAELTYQFNLNKKRGKK